MTPPTIRLYPTPSSLVGKRDVKFWRVTKFAMKLAHFTYWGFDIITHFKLLLMMCCRLAAVFGLAPLLSKPGGAHAFDCMDSSKHSRSSRNMHTNSTMKQKDL